MFWKKFKKKFLTTLESSVGFSGVTDGTSLLLTGVGASIAALIARCTLFQLVLQYWRQTNFFSKLNLRYTELKNWINMLTVLYAETLNETTIHEKLWWKKGEVVKRHTITSLIKVKILWKTPKFHIIKTLVLFYDGITNEQKIKFD